MLPRSPAVLYLALAVTTAAVYLGASANALGFPLDDAWIHQTYARNLGTRGEFAFLPGAPSAGSTAPLWSGLLAVGYLLRLEPRAWAYALGALSLALTAWLAYRLALRWEPARPGVALAAGAAVAVEWHLAWSAVSGMETVLCAAAALAVWALPAEGFLLGVAAGAGVLLRPDALSLLPFVLARLALRPERRWRAVLGGAAGFALVFLPYLAGNVALSGSPWPNTFYAKQAEYASMRDLPLWWRLGTVGLQPLIGAQVLWLPGLAALVIGALRGRRWEILLPLGWAVTLIGAYGLRLPVTYQYGRYVMPVIPVVVAAGVTGAAGLLRPRSPRLWPRVLSRVWLAAGALLVLVFWGWGAVLYRRDVQIIETEMVAAARWVNGNTPAGAVIAAHDVGALGYFGGRRVLDLAGLVSPEVIPFIRDEARLGAWLDAAGADYLMTFPGWYPVLVQPFKNRVVYESHGQASPAAGGENLVIYRWR